jgi:hypothetical protein
MQGDRLHIPDEESVDGNNGQAPHPASDALKRALRHLAELREYAAYYLSARKDATTASVKRAIIVGVLALGAAVVGLGLLIYAAVLLLHGAAYGVSHLLGAEPWLGELIVGFLVLVASSVGAWLLLKRIFRKSTAQTIERYEQRQIQQRRDFGQNVSDRATAAGERE